MQLFYLALFMCTFTLFGASVGYQCKEKQEFRTFRVRQVELLVPIGNKWAKLTNL
jgi:hypothetical protein